MTELNEVHYLDAAVRAGINLQAANDTAFETAHGGTPATGEGYWNTIINGFVRKVSTLYYSYISHKATITVGSGQSFTTIALALAKLYLCNDVTLTITENRVESNTVVVGGKIKLAGDTRDLAGLTYMHGAEEITSTKTNAGSVGSNETIALTNSGNNVTVDCTGPSTDPDFTGWTSSDKVYIVDASNTGAFYDIASVSGNVITLSSTAPTLNQAGCTLTLVPNKKLSSTSGAVLDISPGNNGLGSHIELQGFEIANTADDGIVVRPGAKITLNNCFLSDAVAAKACLRAYSGSTVICGDEVTFHATDDSHGIETVGNAHLQIEGVHFTDCLYGLYMKGGYVEGDFSKYASNKGYGIYILEGSGDLNDVHIIVNGRSAEKQRGFFLEYGRIDAEEIEVYNAGDTESLYGIVVYWGGYLKAVNAIVHGDTDAFTRGIYSDYGGKIECAGGDVDGCDIGYSANNGSKVKADGATASNNSTGYKADFKSIVFADSTDGQNDSNGQDYSPATSMVLGNNDSYIEHDA